MTPFTHIERIPTRLARWYWATEVNTPEEGEHWIAGWTATRWGARRAIAKAKGSDQRGAW